MSPKKGKKSAAKKSAKKDAPAKAASLLDNDADKGKEAKERASADEAVEGNILGSEPLGPSTEHEDHEGGMTDSLAKKGVRGPIPHEGENESGDDEIDPETQFVRAPSVRERQLRRGAVGGNVRPLDAVSALKAENAKDEAEAKVVRVVAEVDGGFYRNKRRHRGDVFDYQMGEGEEKLPTWMTAVDGSVESRRKGEVPPGVSPSTIIEIHPTGGVSVREGAKTTTTLGGISGRRAPVRSAVPGARTGVPPARTTARAVTRTGKK